MGYNTKFSGTFELNKRIDERTFEIIEGIRGSRHDERVMPSIWCQWRVRIASVKRPWTLAGA